MSSCSSLQQQQQAVRHVDQVKVLVFDGGGCLEQLELHAACSTYAAGASTAGCKTKDIAMHGAPDELSTCRGVQDCHVSGVCAWCFMTSAAAL